MTGNSDKVAAGTRARLQPELGHGCGQSAIQPPIKSLDTASDTSPDISLRIPPPVSLSDKLFPKKAAAATLAAWIPSTVLIILASLRKQGKRALPFVELSIVTQPFVALSIVALSVFVLPGGAYEPLPRSRLRHRRAALHRAYHTAQPLPDPVRPHAGASRIACLCGGNPAPSCRCHA